MILKKTLVVFVRDSTELDQSLNGIAGKPYHKLLVIGLHPYTCYRVTETDDQIQIAEDKSGHFRSTSEGTLYLDMDK